MFCVVKKKIKPSKKKSLISAASLDARLTTLQEIKEPTSSGIGTKIFSGSGFLSSNATTCIRLLHIVCHFVKK